MASSDALHQFKSSAIRQQAEDLDFNPIVELQTLSIDPSMFFV